MMFHNGTKSVFIQNTASGTSAERPTWFVPDGYLYMDKTLGKPIYKLNDGWVDATGAAV
jgi:hypothetical protein